MKATRCLQPPLLDQVGTAWGFLPESELDLKHRYTHVPGPEVRGRVGVREREVISILHLDDCIPVHLDLLDCVRRPMCICRKARLGQVATKS